VGLGGGIETLKIRIGGITMNRGTILTSAVMPIILALLTSMAESRIGGITMNWETILTSVAMPIILALLTSIGAVVINAKAARKADKEKREYERADFVIKKLYALLERLESLHGFIKTLDDMEKTFQNALDKRLTFVELYKTSRPIISKRFCKEIDEIMDLEKNLYSKMQVFLNQDDSEHEEERNIAIQNWWAAASPISDALSKAMQNQISYYFDKEATPQ
jgi:hypothetical protein